MPEIELVTTQDELAAVIDAVRATPLIAVDTEFVRETTYYPQLCLVQIAAADLVACVDCLAPLDLEPLFAAVLREQCTWLLHSARQDLEVIWQRTARLPHRLIDTQVAAALAGMPPQIGLEALLLRTVQVVLGDSFARTDWSKRPLPPAALRYALDDVRYLGPAWQQLHDQLDALGRSTWLIEDSERLLAEPPVADIVTVWLRLKGSRTMTAAQQCAALALVDWREQAAQRANRPRRWILADDVLLAIAYALPASIDELGAVAPARFATRFGAQVLAALEQSVDSRWSAIVAEHAARATPDKQQLRSLQELVRNRAAGLNIEPEILATRRDLAALAAGDPPAHLRAGWRADVLDGLLGASVVG